MRRASRGWWAAEMPAGPSVAAAVFAWLHLVAVGLAVGLLLSEYWMCRRIPDRLQVRLLGTVDLGYFLALIGSLATGLARMRLEGQDTAYYLANRLFWLKIALFIAIGLIALFPARQYIRWNREARTAPAFAPLTRELERVRGSLALQLGLMLLLPLLAILTARGYGLPAPHL
jgi:putative membrane protein